MMISRIDHVSIAVKEEEHEKAVQFFRDILGAIPGVGFNDTGMNFYWHIYSLGDLSRLEIMKPTGDESFLSNFLKDKDGGVHHITLETPDIYDAKKILEKHNIPYFGFHDMGDIWKELFIHPRYAFGVLIQIAEFNPDDWVDQSVKCPPGKKFSVTKMEDRCRLTLAHPGGGKVEVDLTKDEAERLAGELGLIYRELH
jgi:methylmalonyl-CoA/ethylmalonyl-CoA epimerase